MNWGYRIVIAFSLFAAGILTLVIKSMNTKIDMVTQNYYAEELRYQQVIDGRRNVLALSSPVKITQPAHAVEMVFPREMWGRQLNGRVVFYRPSDAGKDMAFPLQLDGEGRLVLGRERFSKGSYRIKLQWQAGGHTYYQEEQIYIY